MMPFLLVASVAIAVIEFGFLWAATTELATLKEQRDNDTKEYFKFDAELKDKQVVVNQQAKQIEAQQHRILELNQELSGWRAWHQKVSEALSTK